MGRKKEKTIQRNCRLPLSIDDFVERRAKWRHGQDYTAAIIELLSIAREAIIEQEKYLQLHKKASKKEDSEFIGGAVSSE